MRCDKCNEYLPEGLEIKKCLLCDSEVNEEFVKPISKKTIKVSQIWIWANIVLIILEFIILLAISGEFSSIEIYFGGGLGDLFFFYMLIAVFLLHIMFTVVSHRRKKTLIVVFFLSLLLDLLIMSPAFAPFSKSGTYRGIRIGNIKT